MKINKLVLALGLAALVAFAAFQIADAVHVTNYATIGSAILAHGVILPGSHGLTVAHIDPETGRLNINAMRPFIGKNGEARIVANKGGKAGSIVTNAPATLRHEDWRDIDRAVVEATTQRMVGISDLQSLGLTYNLGSIGVSISTYEKASDMTDGDISMDGITEGEKDRQAFDQANVPVPVVHKDWDLNLRNLEASRRFNSGLDVSGAAIAGRIVGDKSEGMLFSGAAVNVGGSTIYGYTTHPHRNTVDMDTSWATATVKEILEDVQAMLAKARADGYYGPYYLYIPGTYEGRLDDDYVVGDPEDGVTVSTKTIRQRILELQGIVAIRVADKLATDNVILVQMTRDVVDLAYAQDVTTVQWPMFGGFQLRHKTFAIWTPRVKSEYSGKSGVVHLYQIP
jgi:uncharacterized linocin/CFP29 family protein